MYLILLVILLVVMFGGLPHLGLHQYGYAPSGLVFVLLVALVIYLIVGGRL